jgi:hypothetical protein
MVHTYDNVKIVNSLIPAVVTTATSGSLFVDTQGYHDGMLIVTTGAVTSTGTDTYTVTVFEGDTTASMLATTIAATVGGTTANSTVAVARITDLNVVRKRYLQARLTMTATTISFAGSAVFALGNKESNPVN